MDRKNLVKPITFLILFILIVNFAANKFYWYYSIWYFDMIMHTFGGLWVGLLGLYLFPSESFRFSLESKALTGAVFKILLFVLIVGIGWELFEIAVNDVIAKNPFDYIDSASDVFFDLFGGLCGILYVWKQQKKQLR